MTPYVLGILVSLFGVALQPQESAQGSAPSVTIVLPEAVNSESVQISYFMIGPFGGYGSSVPAKPDASSYKITAAVEGQPAQAIKIIIYASGCKIQKFDLEFSVDKDLPVEFACEPLPTITLAGQIASELRKDENTEVVVKYMANWAHRFYGISDGPIVELQIATVKPASDGTFSLDIPDFSADTTPMAIETAAALHLTLRNSKTLNHIAYGLEPELPEFRTETHELRIQSTYPASLRFLPVSL